MPPLSMSDGFSSMDEGSVSSIDLSQMNFALANATHPMSTLYRHRMRTCARGHGHRRRASQAIRHSRRSSVYETTEEEIADTVSPPKLPATSVKDNATIRQPIFVVDSDAASIDRSTESIWDDENGIMILRKYYALCDEAECRYGK